MSGKAMAATIAALAFGCLLAIGVLFATGAQAQTPQCAPRSEMIKALSDQYKETPADVGTAGDGHAMMELYGNEETGTWTFLVTNSEGNSCIAAAGENYVRLTAKAPKGEAM